MALHWNIERCADFESLKTEEEWPKTETIIFATMAVDIGEITEKNVDEFLFRLRFFELAPGVQPYRITRSDIAKRVGLTTNVGTESRAGFLRKTTSYLVREVEWKLREEAKQEEAHASV